MTNIRPKLFENLRNINRIETKKLQITYGDTYIMIVLVVKTNFIYAA